MRGTGMVFRGLRSRGTESGGRGPQIADGTFEGCVAPSGGPRPAPFEMIAWAPNPSPSIELWCVRNGAKRIEPQANSARDGLFLEKVVSGEFEPPVGYAADSNETREALAEYAAARFRVEPGGDPAENAANWNTVVVRPWQVGLCSSPPVERVQRDLVYAVYQDLQPGGDVLTAWVWVAPDPGGGVGNAQREIWLHFRPGLPGGFAVVGSTIQGSSTPLLKSRLRFAVYEDILDYEQWTLDQYAATLETFMDWAIIHPDSPAHSTLDLEVVDYRLCAS
ncbi:MAG: hypothetical protein H6806_01365 [Planctomycetes bacterium]|nr:hypothetical protein [Planctomycetota bacterium]MCB9828397.1 hypothetical protein [Planctomycetota bacterium]